MTAADLLRDAERHQAMAHRSRHDPDVATAHDRACTASMTVWAAHYDTLLRGHP